LFVPVNGGADWHVTDATPEAQVRIVYDSGIR
jgi:hypothetical protein